MRILDFSRPDAWELIAICYLADPGSEENAHFWETVFTDIVSLNAPTSSVGVWTYEDARRNCTPGSRYDHKSTCDHCGAYFCYGAAYRHSITGEVGIVGNRCAGQHLCLDNNAYLEKKLRKVVKAARTRAANKLRTRLNEDKIQHLTTPRRDALNCNHNICIDLRNSFIRYGALTVKQWRLARRLYRGLKQAPATNIPRDLVGTRKVFRGRVVSTRFASTPWGVSRKMLLIDDRGFKLWGSIPSNLAGDPTDRQIEFRALIQISDRDPAFGFFSRPTRARYVVLGGVANA